MTSKIDELWANGADHDPRSEMLFEHIADIDYHDGNDYFDWKSGGDGDNGEHLMYILDIYFERMDRNNGSIT
jgi:hypothetical protein